MNNENFNPSNDKDRKQQQSKDSFILPFIIVYSICSNDFTPEISACIKPNQRLIPSFLLEVTARPSILHSLLILEERPQLQIPCFVRIIDSPSTSSSNAFL